jgi:hypothetical protein
MAQATDERTAPSPRLASLREHALQLAQLAAREPDYHRRRQLEQAALSAWAASRTARKAVRS